MKVIERTDATASLAEYAADIGNDPLVVTSHGQPVAALVPIENADMETVALSTNREFLDLIERSRARARAEGGISSQEMRRRFEQMNPRGCRTSGCSERRSGRSPVVASSRPRRLIPRRGRRHAREQWRCRERQADATPGHFFDRVWKCRQCPRVRTEPGAGKNPRRLRTHGSLVYGTGTWRIWRAKDWPAMTRPGWKAATQAASFSKDS